jgi:hypothetical protein
MRLKRETVTALAIAALCVAATAQAGYMPENVVNVDFNGRDDDDTPLTYAPTTALIPGSGTTWNGIVIQPANPTQTVSGTNLLNGNGGATTIGVSLANVGGDNNNAGTDAANNDALFRDYAYSYYPDAGYVIPTLTISGLSPYAVVDVAFYEQLGAGNPLSAVYFVPSSAAGTLVDIGNGYGILPFYGVQANNLLKCCS